MSSSEATRINVCEKCTVTPTVIEANAETVDQCRTTISRIASNKQQPSQTPVRPRSRSGLEEHHTSHHAATEENTSPKRTPSNVFSCHGAVDWSKTAPSHHTAMSRATNIVAHEHHSASWSGRQEAKGPPQRIDVAQRLTDFRSPLDDNADFLDMTSLYEPLAGSSYNLHPAEEEEVALNKPSPHMALRPLRLIEEFRPPGFIPQSVSHDGGQKLNQPFSGTCLSATTSRATLSEPPHCSILRLASESTCGSTTPRLREGPSPTLLGMWSAPGYTCITASSSSSSRSPYKRCGLPSSELTRLSVLEDDGTHWTQPLLSEFPVLTSALEWDKDDSSLSPPTLPPAPQQPHKNSNIPETQRATDDWIIATTAKASGTTSVLQTVEGCSSAVHHPSVLQSLQFYTDPMRTLQSTPHASENSVPKYSVLEESSPSPLPYGISSKSTTRSSSFSVLTKKTWDVAHILSAKTASSTEPVTTLSPRQHHETALNPNPGPLERRKQPSSAAYGNIEDEHVVNVIGQPFSLDQLPKDIIGRIPDIAKLQSGSRYLQRLLSKGQPEVVALIFREVFDHIIELMIDPYGNYFCQQLFQACTEEQRKQIVISLTSDVYQIACDRRGTHSLQTLVSLIQHSEEQFLFVRAFNSRTFDLSLHPHGTHIIQRVLTCFCEPATDTVLRAVVDNLEALATNPHGLCVVKKSISAASAPNSKFKKELLGKLTALTLPLVQSPFGNYAIQHALHVWSPVTCGAILRLIQENVAELSAQKFSSNAVEKAIDVADDAYVAKTIETLIQLPVMSVLMESTYGSFVVQKALERATQEQTFALFLSLTGASRSLQGKRLRNKWDKVFDAVRAKLDGSHHQYGTTALYSENVNSLPDDATESPRRLQQRRHPKLSESGTTATKALPCSQKKHRLHTY